ncbi:nuclear transport factor 2 family protein [Algihabitans albus]|uniref:nuclear transport factor 2 family protein n=1 Tax=Algihabitans albus TaxID=2164067 RepID=UPI000E5D0637|nr:nuclear transport factor 2 family protein [Algihabitans albus]
MDEPMQAPDDPSRQDRTSDAPAQGDTGPNDTERNAEAQAALAEDVEALLATFQDRLLERDFDALRELMTDDFTYVDQKGFTLDRPSLLERERRGAENKPETEIQHRLLSATGDGRSAEALVELRFRTVIRRGSSETVYEGRGRERVTLAREASSWRFKAVVIEEQKMTRNGQAAGEEAIEEMHRGS